MAFSGYTEFSRIDLHLVDVLKIYQKEDNVTVEDVESLIDSVAHSKVRSNRKTRIYILN